MNNRTFSKIEIENILKNVVGKTLGQVDKNNVFEKTKIHPKITGIAGDVIEQSVFEYNADSNQEPDLLVDNLKVELKTTGLKRVRKQKDNGHTIEAKEPMSITAVSPDKIVNEIFSDSNLWHKLERMLLVYYLYDSNTTVTASEYADFPIQGFQFHEFNGQDAKIIENDWRIVRDFIINLKETLDDPTAEYPKISQLRDKMLYMDTAPKYPNPPRFRLKRQVVSTIAQEHFGNGFVILEKQRQFTSYDELDTILHDFTEMYKGKSVMEIANQIGLTLTYRNGVVDKKINEQILTSAFGVTSGKLRSIDTFAKIGTIPKTLTLTKDGGRTEDTKFDTIDFTEWSNPDITFEESSIYDFFANQTLLFSIFEEIDQISKLELNLFKGFKRLNFDEDFINTHVKKVWDDVRNLLFSNTFKVTQVLDKNGELIINKKTGTIREKTNFPKAKDNVIFLRGTGQDSTTKTLNLMGHKLYQQQYWIKGSVLVEMLSKKDYI